MVVVIPPVRRLGIVAIELQPRITGVQVENIRVAIAVGIVCNTIYSTTHLDIFLYKNWVVFYTGA
jgi:hypothetical protein